MEELESQIAKIQLGNNKTATSFVHTMAEKAPNSPAELYVVAELPLLNPAAEESCERICLAISSGLKRAYKKQPEENSFENAVNQINEELAKLAELGQTQWIDKLNCILGVKVNNTFHIATCGKVSAYLLRSGEYTDISCSPAQSHPLKTFENYASGKIRLGDLLILSTTQMFNYLSMDRLLDIVSNNTFLSASQTILELLKGNAEPQVSFGVLFNLQAAVGEIPEQDVDLENYVVESKPVKANILDKSLSYLKDALMLGKKQVARKPKTDLPNISFGERLKNIGDNTKNIGAKSKAMWQTAKNSAESVKSTVNVKNLKGLSPQKKFFLVSACVLLIAVIANIEIASRVANTRKVESGLSTQLKDAQSLLANAQASLLYKDSAAAAKYFQQAKAKIPDSKTVPSSQKDLYNKTISELNNTQNLMEKTIEPIVTDLGSLAKNDNLIKLPNYVGAQVNQTIISYNKQNSKVEDGALSLPLSFVANSYLNDSLSAVYDGSNLYVWDFSAGKLSPGFNQNVPAKGDFAGLAMYPTNSRVYMVNKKSAQVVSFLAGKGGFSKPVISINDPSLATAQDLAIDSSIYVLTDSKVVKFQNGRLATFDMALTTPLSGKGKIYTQKDFVYIYLMDSGNNRIVILDKKGNLINTIKSSKFTALKDFQVDEKGKIIYVLNDGSLLKVTLP